MIQTKNEVVYATFENMVEADDVFDKLNKADVTVWNSRIRGYASNQLYHAALAVFYQMQMVGVRMDRHTFPCLLKVCSGLLALQLGKIFHGRVIRTGFQSDVFVGNALVAMYAKCACIQDARQVFDLIPQRNEVSWNSMIAGYARLGYNTESLQLFCQMELEDLEILPGSMTIASVLPACANLGDLIRGKEIHAYVSRNGFKLDVSIGTTLVDMYAKCNSTENARKIFDRMSQRDVASWNTMITGYVRTGHFGEALKIFCKMQRMETKPTSLTIASLLPACSHLTTLRHGRQMHDYAVKCRFDCNGFVGSAIMDMYVKCGSLDIARKVFNKMSERDVICWTTMIMGYALHGFGEDALILFDEMQEAGVNPNYVTFIAVLTACSHSGMADEAWKYFNCMKQDYLIAPRLEHYACMVDLLGRAGCLEEAYEFIKSMPVEPDAGVWGTLLGACRVHCNTDLGKEVAEHIFELEPGNAGYYVLLSNIHAAVGNWDDVSKLKLMVKDGALKKNRALSWIEVKNSVHAFLAEDR